MSRKGFTLIEMLVVVAIIGLLAAALLIAINPIEQTNKARDAGALAKGKEFINACERYYASHGDYPTGCAADLEPDEVRTGFCASMASNVPPVGRNPADCTASFVPLSNTYDTACGGDKLCSMPAEPTSM